MPKNTYRVVTRGPDGGLRTRDFPNAEYLQKTHTQIGVDDCSTDLEIRGLPVFRGLIGPMPEGKNIVRYETPEVFEALTKEWSTTKTSRRSRRKPAATIAAEAEAAAATEAAALSEAALSGVAAATSVAPSAETLDTHESFVEAITTEVEFPLQLDDAESLELSTRRDDSTTTRHAPHAHEPHLPQLGGAGLTRPEHAEQFDYR